MSGPRIDWERGDIREQLEAFLLRQRDGLERATPEAVRAGTLAMHADVQKRTAKLKRSARNSSIPTLVRAWRFRFEPIADGLEGVIGNSQLLMLWLDQGTGRHGPRKRDFVIEPKRARGLFWGATTVRERKTKTPRFVEVPLIVRRVIHPGSKGKFVSAAAQAVGLTRMLAAMREAADG